MFVLLLSTPLLVSRHSRWRNTTPVVCTIMISVCLFLLQPALSFCCSDTPYAADIGTFHRFKLFSAIDVFQARRTTFVPAALIHLFQLRGRAAGVYRKSCGTERLLREIARFECAIYKVSFVCKGAHFLLVLSNVVILKWCISEGLCVSQVASKPRSPVFNMCFRVTY